MIEWLEPESWQAFVEMRRKIKAPLTPYAEKLILRELVRLKTAGQNPQACLEQSIMNGWRDVFPLRDKGLSTAHRHECWKPDAPLSNDELAAAAVARKAAMSAIRRVA